MDISTIKLPPQVQVLRSAADKPELATMDAATKKNELGKDGSQQQISSTGSHTAAETSNKTSAGESSSTSGSSSLSPIQAILKRLSEQIANIREKIAEMEGELSRAMARSGGEPSAEVDSLRNQLEGLQNQLTSLTGSYNDALKELNKAKELPVIGSNIDILQ